MKDRPSYLNQLLEHKDKEQIKVITGIRRCGKSKLLDLYIEHLKKTGVNSKNLIKYDFESLRYQEMTYKVLYDDVCHHTKKLKGKVYLFFDEVQKIPQWELAINSFRVDLDADIYITGSNAYLLSSQLSTYLSGRYVEIKMLPLSFKEFLEFHTLSQSMSIKEKFAIYIRYGGMPILAEYNFKQEVINQVLEGILSTVIVKDVIVQAEMRDNALLDKIIKYLADNIGNTTSPSNIKNTLLSQKRIEAKTAISTIDNYILLLERAFVFFGVNRYDIKGKDYLKTQLKYYIVDIGLRNYLLGFREMDRGHILENVVYLELLRRGYHVCIGKNGTKEVDFIATSSTEKLYIQVCETLAGEEVRMRELSPLQSINDNYRKQILTLDDVFVNNDENGIEILNLITWLLA